MNQVAADLEKQYPEAIAGYRVAVIRPRAADAKRAPIITVLGLPRSRSSCWPAPTSPASSWFAPPARNPSSPCAPRSAPARALVAAAADRASRARRDRRGASIGVVSDCAAAALGRLIPIEQLDAPTLGCAPIVFLIALTDVTARRSAGSSRARVETAHGDGTAHAERGSRNRSPAAGARRRRGRRRGRAAAAAGLLLQ
jgi:hypothetical protein